MAYLTSQFHVSLPASLLKKKPLYEPNPPEAQVPEDAEPAVQIPLRPQPRAQARQQQSPAESTADPQRPEPPATDNVEQPQPQAEQPPPASPSPPPAANAPQPPPTPSTSAAGVPLRAAQNATPPQAAAGPENSAFLKGILPKTQAAKAEASTPPQAPAPPAPQGSTTQPQPQSQPQSQPSPSASSPQSPPSAGQPQAQAQPQSKSPTQQTPAAPQSQPQPAAPNPASVSNEQDPVVAEAFKQVEAEMQAEAARKKREDELADLEARGMKTHAKTLRELDAEMAARRASLDAQHPDHGAEYRARMQALEKEKEARQASVMQHVEKLKAMDRTDDLRAAKFIVNRESKLPKDRSKTEEQKQAEWRSRMEKAGLNPNYPAHVDAYWDAQRLHSLNSGRYASSNWDGSTPPRQGFGSAVLSDGALHVAPEFIHNDKKYAAVVAASGASDEEKARAMAELPHLQQAYAQAMLPILKQAGSTRAAEWIPGIASFQKWQGEQPRQGTEAEQANQYLKEMNQRGAWSKATDNGLRSLLAGFADMGTMAAGVAGMAGFKGASEAAAEWSKSTSDFLAPISAEGGNSGAASNLLGHVARMAGPMAATLLITRGLGGGLGTTAALSGAQTAGSQYAETYGRLREEGQTHADAWKATAPWALASGFVTAVLTAAGGRTGFEAALGVKGGAQTAVKDAAQSYWKNLLRNVPKNALAEIPQELPDELFSQISSALATNPKADLDKVVGDFIQNSPQLLATIAVMGGTGGVIETHQQSSSRSTQPQIPAATPADTQAQGEAQPPSAEHGIPDNTTKKDAASNTPTAGQSEQAPASQSQPPSGASSAAKPSRPPLDADKSRELIANVEDIQKHRPLGEVEEADLDQARRVVKEDEAQKAQATSSPPKAQPSTPPLSVADSQRLINNVMDRPPEQRGHEITQADLAQAQRVVQEQKLESQKQPRSEAQEQELADAKTALGRVDPGKQHISGGRPELPEGAKLLQSSEHWFIYEQGGRKWVRFYAPEARSPNNVVEGGVGSQTDPTSALLNREGRIYVEEGQHRLTGVVKKGTTNQNTVPGHPKWLEYEFHGDTDAVGHPPDYSNQKPFKFDSDNPYTNLEGYD